MSLHQKLKIGVVPLRGFLPVFGTILSVVSFFLADANATTTNIVYSGASQSWTVPPNVTSISITLTGAAGGTGGNDGGNSGAAGGSGGSVTGTLAVTAGETLTFYVGGAGGNGASASTGGSGTAGNAGGGYAGGRGGNAGSSGTSGAGGGGGGAVAVLRGTNVLAVAGGAGGGGGAGNTSLTAGVAGTTGSYTTGTAGAAGADRGSGNDGGGGGGGGGGYTRGGAGGTLRSTGNTDSGGNGGSAGENFTGGLTGASASYISVSGNGAVQMTYTALPSAPVISSATATDTTVTLSWSAPASGPAITDYIIKYLDPISFNWVTFSDGVSTSTSATVTGLNHNSIYAFQVAAVNADGTGAYSNPYDISTLKNFLLTVSGGSSSYTLLGSAVAVDPSLTIVDQTSGTNTAAKVQISSGFQEGDALALPSGSGYAGITGSYNPTNGILTLSGSGNAAAYQAAIRAVTFSTTNTSTSARTIGITLGNAIAYGNHFYEVVTNSVTWPTARSGALAKSLFGIPGYLVNITSSGENQFILSKVSTTAWIGASDSGTEGTWKWMDGPEAGTTFWNGAASGSAPAGQYANWNTNEPNDSGGGEDYASIYSGVGVQDGKWNDYSGSGPYIVEYGNPNAVITFSGSKTLSVQQASQTITFSTLPSKTFGDAAFNLTATGGGSGNPVTYTSSNTNVATVSGSTVTIVGVGSTTITANQAGNSNYSAAPAVNRTLTVNQAAQTITFNTLPSKTFGDAAFNLTATGGGSGNPVTYTSSNTNVATVSSGTVTIRGAGTTTITANQAGNANYAAASPVARTLTVNKAAQTITFGALSSVNYSANGTVSLTATGGGSTSPVTYTSSSLNVATVFGSTLTIRGVGTTTITASQLGDANYEDAVDVSRTLTVNPVYAPVYGATDLQNFNGADINSTPRFANGWSASDPGIQSGVYADGYRTDGAGDVFASVGGYTTTQPKPRLTYQFAPGSSDRLVFTWKQNVETSGPDYPAVDRFGWEFKSGTNTLFALKMVQFVDSNGNGTWDPANSTNSTSAEPLAGDNADLQDKVGGSVNPTNGVSLFVTNKVVVAGYSSAGARLTTADQPNFAVLDRNSWYEFRVIVDLREDRWWAQINNGTSFMNLMGDAGAPLPSGTTTLDQMVALWELNDTRRDQDFLYQDGGSNMMLFDDLSIQGSKIVHLGLSVPANAVYNGSAQGATATDESTGTAQINYSLQYSGVTNTSVPINYGTYITTVGLGTNSSPYFAVVGTNSARLYTNSATITLNYTIDKKSVTVTNVGVANKIYDGNTNATITGTPTINGKVGSDDVSLAGTGSASFTTADAGAVKLATISGYSLTGTAASNYQLTGLPISASAEISKKGLTVSAQAKTKTYGDSDPALTYASSGLVGADAISGSLAREVGENVAVYAIEQGSLDAGSNYNINFTGANFTITAAPLPAVSFTPPADLIYSGAAKTHIASASGVSGFTYLYTGTNPVYSSSNAPVNAGSYRLVVTSADANYSGTATNNFIITKATPSIISAPSASGITYGQTLADSTLSGGSGSVAGSFDFTSPSTAPNAGTASQGITFTPTDTANYNPATGTVDVTVAKATPTITASPTASDITYGQTLADSALSGGSGSVAGSFDFTSPSTAPNAGTASQGVTFTPTDTANYNPATGTVDVTVAKASQTINFPWLSNGTVGGSATLTATSTSGLTVSYASSDPSVATISGSTVNFVGVGLVNITASQAGDNNYEPASDDTITLSVLSADTPWDTWADGYGMASGAERAKNSDPDGDGFTNALEFAFGTNPKVRNAEIFVSATKSGSNYVVTFKKRKLASDATYDIRSSTDLKQAFSSGTTMSLGTATSVDANYEQTSVSLPLSGPRGFVRMQATVLVSPTR